MVLTNLVLPNSSHVSIKQEKAFPIIVAYYAADFFFLSINTWLLAALWLVAFWPMFDIYFI